MELAELVAGATIKRRLRSKQTVQRRLTKKQPLSGNNLPQSSDPATETVPDEEEHPTCARQYRILKFGRASCCAGEDGTMASVD